MIIVKYIWEFIWSCRWQCGVSSVSHSSLFQLILLLKVYRPFPMQSVLTQGFNLLHLSLPEQFPLLYFGFLCLQVSSVSNFWPDTRGPKWSLIQAHLFSCSVGREEHCKQISVVYVGSACSVQATLGLPPLTVCVLSQSYTAQAPGCSAGELSNAGPGLDALPRSKPPLFRFLGTPQRH